jgi:Ras-related protein Rab-1A
MNNDIIYTYKYYLKPILIGNVSVGKTSIMKRYCHNEFVDESSTIGIDIGTKIFNDETKLTIYDSAGLERYHSFISSYYKTSDGFLLVYDCSDITTFNDVKKWYKEINDINYQDKPIFLVCNKIDIKDRFIDKNIGQNLANILKIPYYEVSAKSGIGIDKMFIDLVNIMIKKEGKSSDSSPLIIDNKIEEKKKINRYCCL